MKEDLNDERKVYILHCNHICLLGCKLYIFYYIFVFNVKMKYVIITNYHI